jgi:hypothetical protein
MTAARPVAAWLQPVLLLALVHGVTAGAPDAPWLALAALVAPLVALLHPRDAGAPPPATTAVAAVSVALVLGADFLVAADAAVLLGGAPWHGAGLATAGALLALAWPSLRRATGLAVVLAAAALLLPLLGVAAVAGAAPWTAWRASGSRPAPTFSERGAWTAGGERFARAATLAFAEGQRVTAPDGGVVRVVERDGARPTVREWRLAAGEALTLRPGDELSVPAGTRLAFEPGARVPGAPDSGVAWADPPARGPRMLPGAVGALVTVLGGALALVTTAGGGARAAGAPVLLLVAVSAAVGWGLYAAAAAPELALGGSLVAPLLRLPPLAVGAGAGRALAAVAGAGLLVLLLTGAAALGERLTGPHAGGLVWLGVVAVAAGLTAWPADPWRVFAAGLGLAAAAWAPAQLLGGGPPAAAASVVGGVAFGALAALPALAPAPAWLDALVRYPALLAAPVAWAAGRRVQAVRGARPAPASL